MAATHRFALALVAAFLCLSVAPAAAAITITVEQPSGTIVSSALTVAARVSSTRELAAVSASVDGRTASLVYQAGSGQWVGALSLTGLAHGPHVLTVTATDIDGLAQQAQRPIVLDNPPALTVLQPGPNPLARPDLRVVAQCTDDAGPCTIRVEVLNEVAASATNGLDAVVTVPGPGSISTLRIVAIDSAGQQTVVTRTLYAEASRFLSLVASYVGRILDIADDRAIVLDETTVPNRLLLVNRANGTAGPIWTVADAPSAVVSAALIPGGALFFTAGGGQTRLREWRNGVLTDLGDASSLRVAGQYAIWTALPAPCCILQPLIRRDVVAGTNVTIAGAGVGNIYNDVAADGDVVYWANQGGRYQVFRYDGASGSTTPLTSDPNSHHVYVRTDGTNVLYRRNAPIGNPDSFDLVADGPGGQVTLATSPHSLQPDGNYQVAGGWFAFTRPGGGGSVQVWRRSPGGVEEQLTFAGTTRVLLDRLLPTGELAFQEGDLRYVARTGGARLEVGSTAGWPVFIDGEWHVVLGPHLLRLSAIARSLLAEGATGSFFDTDIVVLNPSTSAVDARISYLREDGVTIEETRTLNPRASTTIRVDTVPGVQATAFATVIEAPQGAPLVVERTMSWDASGYGGHASNAVDGGRLRWMFAEGAQGFFDTYFLLVNDGSAATDVRLTFLREQGAPVAHSVNVPARSRRTLWAGSVAGLANTSFATIVESDRPILAERAMYFGRDPLWRGGHGAAGIPAPSQFWYLAEGATGAAFDTFILLANPHPRDIVVQVRFLTDAGVAVTRAVPLAAMSRRTLNIEQVDPALANAAVATTVITPIHDPILVERAMYWSLDGGPWQDAHAGPGVTAAATRWGLADGRAGGARHHQTFVLLANPNAVDTATVRVTFLREDGVSVPRTYTVGPARRLTVVAGAIAELTDASFGVIVESLNGVPINVERATYWDAGGIPWAAGTNVTGTRLP